MFATWRLVWLGVGLLVATVSMARPTGAEPDVRSRYAGTLHFVGGDEERAAVDRAIERSIQDLSWITRPFARRRLRERNEVSPWITFSFPPGWIEGTVPGHPMVRSPDSGAEIDYRVLDETMRASQRFRGQHLVQTFRSGDGTRVNEYAPDGQKVKLQVTIRSPRLSGPLRYTLTYGR